MKKALGSVAILAVLGLASYGCSSKKASVDGQADDTAPTADAGTDAVPSADAETGAPPDAAGAPDAKNAPADATPPTDGSNPPPTADAGAPPPPADANAAPPAPADAGAPAAPADATASAAPPATPAAAAPPPADTTAAATTPPPAADTSAPAADTSASSSSGSGETYTIHRGDTLMRIAFDHYGDLYKWRTIYDANRDKIKDPNLILVGVVLNLPGTQQPPPELAGQKYEVKTGDTLAAISKILYGTADKWKELWNQNKALVSNPNKIFAGFFIYYTAGENQATTDSGSQPSQPNVEPVTSSAQAPAAPVAASPIGMPTPAAGMAPGTPPGAARMPASTP